MSFLKQILIVLSILSIQNCAFFNAKNRPLTSYLDEKWKVEENATTKKIIYAPVAIPVGITSLALDIVLLHPLETISPSTKDTYQFFWENPQGGTLSQVFLFIPKVVLSPAFWILDVIIRSVFDV